jgi:hypothetical protein
MQQTLIMTHKFLLSLSCLFFTVAINAQVTKNNWLFGGTVSYNHVDAKSDATPHYTRSEFDLGGRVGYFLQTGLRVGCYLNIIMVRVGFPEPLHIWKR